MERILIQLDDGAALSALRVGEGDNTLSSMVTYR